MTSLRSSLRSPALRTLPLLAILLASTALSGCVATADTTPHNLTIAELREDAALIAPEDVQGGTLSHVVAAGLEGNPALMKASADLRQAEGKVAEAASGDDPVIDAVASASQSSNPSGASAESTTSKKAGFTLRKVLYDGPDGGVSGAKEAEAAAYLLSAQGLVHQHVEGAAQEIISAAIAEARAKERMELSEWNIVRIERLAIIAARHVKAGTGFAADVAKARVRLASARTEGAMARQQYDNARAELRRLTGTIDSVSGEIDPPAQVLPRSLDEAVRRAREVSPTVVAAQAKIDALRSARLAVVREGNWPQFAIDIGPLGIATGMASGGMLSLGSIGLDATLHLFDGGKTKGLLRAADGQIQAATAEAIGAERQVEANVRKAWAARVAALVAAKQSGEQARFSEAVAKDFEAQYEAGSRFFLDLLGGQDDLNRARAEGIDAKYALLDSEYRLLGATTTLTETLGVAKTSVAVALLEERRKASLEKDAGVGAWLIDPVRRLVGSEAIRAKQAKKAEPAKDEAVKAGPSVVPAPSVAPAPSSPQTWRAPDVMPSP